MATAEGGAGAAFPEPPSKIQPGALPHSPGPAIDGATHPDAQMAAAPRVPHSWTPCPGTAFQVRQGPNYAVNGKKGPAGPALYDMVAVDAYNSEQKLSHVLSLIHI